MEATMDTWTLLIIILFQGAPRAVTTIDGYTRERCEFAAYSVMSGQQPRKTELNAWCVQGPQK